MVSSSCGGALAGEVVRVFPTMTERWEAVLALHHTSNRGSVAGVGLAGPAVAGGFARLLATQAGDLEPTCINRTWTHVPELAVHRSVSPLDCTCAKLVRNEPDTSRLAPSIAKAM